MSLSPIVTGVLFGLFSMVCWGVSDFLAAQVSRNHGTVKTVLWGHVGGLSILFFASPWLEEQITWNTPLIIFCILGILLYAGAQLLLYKGFETGLVAVLSPIYSAYVVITVLVGLLVFKEQLSRLQTQAVVIVIIGIFLASTDWRQIIGKGMISLTRGLPEVLIATVFAGLFFSVNTFLTRQSGWFSPFLRIRLGSFLLVCALLIITRERLSINKQGLMWIIPAGIFDSMGILAFNLGIQVAPAAILAPIGGSFPFFSILLAMIFYKERPAVNQYIGAVVIIAGIVLLTVSK